MRLQSLFGRLVTASIILGSATLASATILVPSDFHAKITGFTTYADGQFTLSNASGITIGGVVFATITPSTLQVGLPQQNFANFSQAFDFDFTGFQLPAGQVISGLTVIDNQRQCCSTSASFASNSIHVTLTGVDVRSRADSITYQIDFTPSQVPEPASLGLFACGLAALTAKRLRRR
jgi:PEP-CTERM motif